MFKRINIQDWRQFKEIDITFHDHLTVLTGANGAGKTTILNLLSEYIGWEPQFVSSFDYNSEEGNRYKSGHAGSGPRLFIRRNEPEGRFKKLNEDLLGELEFSDGKVINIGIPSSIGAGTYGLTHSVDDKEKGVYIDSHRPTFPYKEITSIPTHVSHREEIYSQFNEFERSFLYDWSRDTDVYSATTLIKGALASLAIFGYGSEVVKADEEARKLLDGYVDILKKVLPPKLGFQTIKVAMPEVLMCTRTGEFPIDAASGGISSIIDITWKLYMYADTREHFVALIDEPENHLHPEMQRSFLGNLVDAFPNVQFIIATHNPFMITSQEDSYVYVLDYDHEHKVIARQLDYVNRAGTSNEILREVLGMDTTMPAWAESVLDKIVYKYIDENLSNEMLASLREDMDKIGLGEYIPTTISRIVKAKDDKAE